MKQIVPVVAACIVKDHRVLLHKKDEPRNPELLGKWEFPGGMIEYGEPPEQALHREIWEEVRMVITIGSLIHVQMNVYNDQQDCYLVLFYKCQSNDFAPLSCQWVDLDNVARIDRLPGTDEVVRKLLGIGK